VLDLRLHLQQRLLLEAGVIQDDVKGIRLPERREEDLIYLGLEFGVFKNKLATRRDRKIGEEYMIEEHRSLDTVP
jgi:hypothetical protein